MAHNKIRRSVWLPLALLLYFGAMIWLFAEEWILSGHWLRLTLTIALYIIIVIALFFALRHKEKLVEKRKKLEQDTEKIISTENNKQ